jgi:hypothetical protein
MTTGYPCSSPRCDEAAAWAVLSENERVGVPVEWGRWNYAATLSCEGHLDAAEGDAIAYEKHYRLIPIALNA